MSASPAADWDALHSVTMLRMGDGKWNVFVSTVEGKTTQFPAVYPDPLEAVLQVAAYVVATQQEQADDYDASHPETAITPEADPAPSQAEAAARLEPVKPRRKARRKR